MLSTFERYQRIALLYDLLDLPFEYGRYRRIRRLLFQELSGRLLEAGVGTGRNFPFYPPGSTVVGIDISPAMLARADRRRKSAAAQVCHSICRRVDRGYQGASVLCRPSRCVESERDRRPSSRSAHQVPLDRNRITEEVRCSACNAGPTT